MNERGTYQKISASAEQYCLEKCVQIVEDKLGWGDSKLWTNSNFERLSNIIFSETKVSISSSTLKRLFGKLKTYKSFYNPQLATKNALSIFIGFKNWDDFVDQQHLQNAPAVLAPLAAFKKKTNYKPVLLIVLTCVIVIILISYFKIEKPSPPSLTLTIDHQTGVSPLETVFEFSNYPKDSEVIKIDFGDGSSRLVSRNDQRKVQHIYPNAGIYRVTLLKNGNVLSRHTVHASTKGWETEVYDNKKLYKIPSHLKANGSLFYSKNALNEFGIKTDSVYWIIHRNVRDFDLSGDEFAIEVRVMNDLKDGGISCYDFNLEVYGMYNDIKTEFLEPECTVWTDFVLSNIKVDGKCQDLSAFGQSLSKWRIIRMEVKDKTAQFFIDNRPIYISSAFKAEIGCIKGLMFGFKGSGKVDFLKLFNGYGELVYLDDF